jgi:hypothetical protein
MIDVRDHKTTTALAFSSAASVVFANRSPPSSKPSHHTDNPAASNAVMMGSAVF